MANQNLMTEKEIIQKIKELGEVRPDQQWILLTKNRIFGEDLSKKTIFDNLFINLRPAFATLTVIAIFFGFFGFAKNSLPGDFLYSLKRMTERGQSVFVSEQERAKADLELTNKRLDELNKIVESNQVRKLASAINEFQASVSEASKSISRVSDPLVIQEVIDKTKEIEEKVGEFKLLGVVIDNGISELQGISNKLKLKSLITNLEKQELEETEVTTLTIIKELFEEEKYSEALNLYLTEFEEELEELEEILTEEELAEELIIEE